MSDKLLKDYEKARKKKKDALRIFRKREKEFNIAFALFEKAKVELANAKVRHKELRQKVNTMPVAVEEPETIEEKPKRTYKKKEEVKNDMILKEDGEVVEMTEEETKEIEPIT